MAITSNRLTGPGAAYATFTAKEAAVEITWAHFTTEMMLTGVGRCLVAWLGDWSFVMTRTECDADPA